MADMNTIASDVAELLDNILGDKIDPMAPTARLVEDYGANSMDVVDIVERLERRFDIKIPNNDIGKLVTFNDVVTYVTTQLQRVK